jgi:hypothetical protein
MGPSASNRSGRARGAPGTSPSSTPYRANFRRASPPDQGNGCSRCERKHRRHCSPFEATRPRICAHVGPALSQGLLADALSAAESSEDRCRGGCKPRPPFCPVSISHDIENRAVATRIDQERSPQVSGACQRSPQVTESARLNLSRWRHGFKSRWDYKQRRWSDTPSRLSGESAGPFVPHLSRGRQRHVTASAHVRPGG